MTSTTRYLTRMVIFVIVVLLLTVVLIVQLQEAFLANRALNGTIAAVLFIGIVFVFRQVLQLGPEIEWAKAYRKSEDGEGVPKPGRLLAPMAAMLGEKRGTMKLSALSTRSVLDGIASRLDEGREISRYLIGLLIFLGLLGTFWGLLGTIGAIGDTIRSLSVGTADLNLMFDDLKRGLEAPLSGMATAFSSSLFGLAGSVVLGFLDLQAGQAQNRFYADLEDWLASETKLARAAGGAAADEEGGSLPAYVTALLEQSADSLDSLQRAMHKSEDTRDEVSNSILSVSERLAALTDQMQAEQSLMAQLADGQAKMQAALEKLAEMAAKPAAPGEDAAAQHLRNIDVHVKRLIEEQSRGRDQLIDEMRSELKLLARTMAAMVDNGRRPS
ncbi:MAG: hypothetical protein MI755_06130 [Sphingomonadales bacterium]|nr:hypothetical protein [Sphingomonadales bacterium]